MQNNRGKGLVAGSRTVLPPKNCGLYDMRSLILYYRQISIHQNDNDATKNSLKSLPRIQFGKNKDEISILGEFQLLGLYCFGPSQSGRELTIMSLAVRTWIGAFCSDLYSFTSMFQLLIIVKGTK